MTDKKTVEALIDKLADKELKFGCVLDSPTGTHLFVRSYREWVICSDYGNKPTDGVYTIDKKEINIIGNPVMIGDILDTIQNHSNKNLGWLGKKVEQLGINSDNQTIAGKLCSKWNRCGFKGSLNEIIVKSGYTCEKQMTGSNFDTECNFVSKLKDPQARELVEFILSLNLE